MANYTIKAGDTLSKIAAANGTTVAALAKANGIADPNKIRAGVSISIPATSAPAKSSSLGLTPPASGVGSTAETNRLLGGSYFDEKTGVQKSAVPTPASTKVSVPSTGNPELDKIQDSIIGLANGIVSSGYTIPDSLQITPELTQQFLEWAHQAVDPQTKQLIDSKLTDINASMKNMATQFGLSKDQTIADFGTDLATEQNTSGNNGVAFSGLRNLTEKNMVDKTNRTLESLNSTYENNMGSTLRGGAAEVGASKAGGFNVPGLSGGMVSNEGGSRGSSSNGRSLDFNYNPSLYTVGNIPTSQNTAVNNLAGNYLGQYTTLAGANTKRSMRDLIPGITGLPSGYQVTKNI